MTTTPTEASQKERESLPPQLTQPIENVRRALNRHVALDAALCGVAAALGIAVPVALLLELADLPLTFAIVFAALAFLTAMGIELRRRWHDRLDAALVLDRLLGAKDRFSSALQFASREEPSTAERLQIQDAAAFLVAATPIPKPPRPPYRSLRYATLASVVLALSAAAVFVGHPLLTWMSPDEETIDWDEPRNAEEIAAAAEELRARLAADPSRRLDAEINALEQELSEQRRRAEIDRATAIREAAELLERAAGIEPATPSASASSEAEGGDEREPNELPRSVTEELPEWASRQLRESWQEAREAMERWREAAAQPLNDPARIAELQREAQRRQMEALSRARQEASWRASRSEEERARERRILERRAQGESSADFLQRSVERLDRALERLHRTDESPEMPPPEVGEALAQAAARLNDHTPRTAREMNRAAQARESGQGEQMDHAIEEARRALQREAGTQPARFAEARRRLDELHDEVARRAARRASASEALAQNQQAGQQGQDGQQGQRQQEQTGRQAQGGQRIQAEQQAQNGQQAQARQQERTGQQGQAGQQGQRQEQAGQQGQPGQQTGQQGQAGQQGAGQRGQGQEQAGQRGQGQEQAGQRGQGQGQAGHGARRPSDGESARGQANVGHGVGGGDAQGTGHGRGSAQLGGGQGEGQTPGMGEGHTPGGNQPGRTGDPSSDGRGHQAWGSGSGEAFGTAESANMIAGGSPPVDPGHRPERRAELAPDARHGSFRPGATDDLPGQSGTPMSGAGLQAVGHGSGELAEGDDDARRVSGESTVPASLRAYVRRYLDMIRRER